jgi:hypothetical protein
MDGDTVPGMDPMETVLAWESNGKPWATTFLPGSGNPHSAPTRSGSKVLSVREGRITKLRDYPTREAAVEAVERAP